MQVIQITNSLYGSIGAITKSISFCLTSQNIENTIFISTGKPTHPNTINYSNSLYKKINALKSKIDGRYGFDCSFVTQKLIRKLQSNPPDAIILHNIHGHDLNLKLLFNFLNCNQNIKCYWMFHDLWAFTGGCCYPDDCLQWQIHCKSCPQKKSFSWFFDSSAFNFELKKEALISSNVHIICPSKWIADSVSQSFLKEKNITILNNGINTNQFRIKHSYLKEKLNITNKKTILYVSNLLASDKGLDQFIELSKAIDDNYVIILIGKLISNLSLPNNIIHINRTDKIDTLIEFYNIADVFLNLTTHDNFPTVNLEAQSCGTPVICTNIGGCSETLANKYSILLKNNNIETIIDAIYSCEKNERISVYLHNYAEKFFNNNSNFNQLVNLIKNECKAIKL